jgi:hypothetical protein
MPVLWEKKHGQIIFAIDKITHDKHETYKHFDCCSSSFKFFKHEYNIICYLDGTLKMAPSHVWHSTGDYQSKFCKHVDTVSNYRKFRSNSNENRHEKMSKCVTKQSNCKFNVSLATPTPQFSLHVCKIYFDSRQLSAIILFIHFINL